MFLISHRGNINGTSELENSTSYIDRALNLGYDVEIDVWHIDKQLWLGHDAPEHKIDLEYLASRKNKLWCHAKNLEAIKILLDNNIHCFWQEGDKFAITSKGYIFTHSKITKCSTRSILVSLNADLKVPIYAAGVCSDYICRYKNG